MLVSELQNLFLNKRIPALFPQFIDLSINCQKTDLAVSAVELMAPQRSKICLRGSHCGHTGMEYYPSSLREARMNESGRFWCLGVLSHRHTWPERPGRRRSSGALVATPAGSRGC